MKRLSLVIASLAFAFVLNAQTAEQIIDEYLEKIGGESAWSNVQSMRMKGSAMTQMGIFPATFSYMKPNKQRMEMNLQGKQMIQAFDGKTAWIYSPMMGDKAQKAPAEAASEMLESRLRNDFLNYRKRGTKVNLLGKKEVGGKTAFEVKLTTAKGETKLYYFDPQTYLPIMSSMTLDFGEDEKPKIEVYFDDFRRVEGLLMPFSVEQQIGGQSLMQINADRIELNPKDLTEASFAFPSDKP